MTDFDMLSALAKELTQQRRMGGGKTPVCQTITGTGATTIYTLTNSANFIRLFWAYAMNKGAGNPTISIKIGTKECYRVANGLSHWEVFDGAVGDNLIVTLDDVGPVIVTCHILELPPGTL